MSEYQRYQWKVVGRSLSPQQRSEVSELSSHISVRSDSAEVSYHWGDFKHDPISVLERYFDLFLYEANWGTQRVVFRFDADTVEVEELSMFATGETITVVEKGGSVLIETWFEENWIEPSHGYYHGYDESDWQLDAVEEIRRQWMEGDYRGLFLLWLKACQLAPEENADRIVPLPRGMGQLGDEHRALADFVDVDGGVMKAAAEHPNAIRSLCDQFDTATQGGSDMSHYAGLVASALRTIEATFRKRATTSLLSGRDGLLPTAAETVHADDGDWELVTWLVVRNPV